jgi:hypothetical protein
VITVDVVVFMENVYWVEILDKFPEFSSIIDGILVGMTRGGGIEPAATEIGASLGEVEFCLEIAFEGRARGFATGLNTAPPFSDVFFEDINA